MAKGFRKGGENSRATHMQAGSRHPAPLGTTWCLVYPQLMLGRWVSKWLTVPWGAGCMLSLPPS